jgi:hypothetical protein
MGSYGIGVGRNVACIVEEHHDDKGIVWPAEVAPYAAHLVSIGAAKEPRVLEVAERLHSLAAEAGDRHEILWDDRDESPGVKFTDAELLGMPWILTVSPRSLAAGGVEVTERATGARSTRPMEDVEGTMAVGSTVVPSSASTSSPPSAAVCSTSSADDTTSPATSSGSSPIRPIAKLTAGGIDAEIEISAIRYGEPFSRRERLVISCSAVARTMSSASVLGSIFSMTVVTPRRAMPIASRAPFEICSAVAGSLAVRSAIAATWAAASWARLMKLIGPSLVPPGPSDRMPAA